jgi:hypothetical protein
MNLYSKNPPPPAWVRAILAFWLTLAIWGLLAYGCQAAATNTILVPVTDAQGVALTNITVTLAPAGGGRTSATNLLPVWTVTNLTDTAGLARFTNVVNGSYAVTIYATRVGTTFQVAITNAVGTTNMADFVTASIEPSNIAAYTTAQADARFLGRTNGFGADITITNLTILGTASGLGLTDVVDIASSQTFSNKTITHSVFALGLFTNAAIHATSIKGTVTWLTGGLVSNQFIYSPTLRGALTLETSGGIEFNENEVTRISEALGNEIQVPDTLAAGELRSTNWLYNEGAFTNIGTIWAPVIDAQDGNLSLGSPGGTVTFQATPIFDSDTINIGTNRVQRLFVSFEAALTNASLVGSNGVNGNLTFTPASISSLTAGANILNPYTNVLLYLSGPAAEFSIVGLQHGWSGRTHLLRNATAYTLTLANESGLCATAGDRILTGSGQDLVVGAGECFQLFYDAGVSRWRAAFVNQPAAVSLLSVSNLHWLAPQWDDLAVQTWTSGRTNAYLPDMVDVDGTSTIRALGFLTNRVLYGSIQLPHGQAWTNSTFPDFYVQPHVHISLSNAPSAGATNVTFHLDYQWASIGGDFTAVSGTLSNTIGISAATTHTLLGLGYITNNAAVSNLSGVLRFRLWRGLSPSNIYPSTMRVILDAWDVHVPRMRLGSSNPYTD